MGVTALQITLNGETINLSDGISVADIIVQRGLKPETVIVEYNYELLKREAWPGTFLKEKDNVEILHFVGGG